MTTPKKLTREEGNARPFIVATKYPGGPTVYHMRIPEVAAMSASRKKQLGMRVSLKEGLAILKNLYTWDSELRKLGSPRHFLVWVETRY